MFEAKFECDSLIISGVQMLLIFHFPLLYFDFEELGDKHILFKSKFLLSFIAWERFTKGVQRTIHGVAFSNEVARNFAKFSWQHGNNYI